ncbi:hypothetical protein [Arsenicicoccus sp. oral taxon 190]|uniref:hypothetical protein n=1 Tax=Arsenicicoccus sp. oral taxon 190 TaxID=1658671 RepID=UPI00067A3466|nr:hypothetical protein [Arsenicicoccus sp. oral taxon 190]AKT50180.1 hypothetical protein ADJ73_00480 [Arsenicicoccus sp. oral taxon 190]
MSGDTIVLGDNEIRDYVTRVRRALDDLRADDLDELTVGMEADLAEIRSEAGSLLARLGEPEDYAVELRAAAGLPPRSAVASRIRGMREAAAQLQAAYAETVQRHTWLRATQDYLVTLRPAWWLARAFLAVWCLHGILGVGAPVSVLLLLVAVPVSVWLGLRRRQRSHATAVTMGLLDTVGVLVALVFAGQLVDRFYGFPDDLLRQAQAPVSAPG